MKNKISRLTVFTIMAFLTVVLISCSPGDDEGVRAEAAGNNIIKNTAVDKSDTDREKKDDSLLSKISEPEGRDFLLYTNDAADAVYPEDFEIGALQNFLEIDEQTEGIAAAADQFLSSVIDMDPSYDLVASDKREFVERNISYSLEQAVPLSYRLGLINTQVEPVRADVRLEGKESFAEGTIYFIMEGSWKVFDFHMDFEDLKKEETPVESVWYPSEKLM